MQALRIAGLVIATLCLVSAIGFTANAAWRLAVRTDVRAEPTTVDSAAIAQQIVAQSNPNDKSENDQNSDPVERDYNLFKKNFWPKYYAIYRNSHSENSNKSDAVISSQDLMDQLGYTQDFYRQTLENKDFGEAALYAERIKRMVSDTAYQTAALKHVAEAMKAPILKPKMEAYKTATKSEQRCTTTPRTERITQQCGYYYVYDCSYNRTVEDRRCEAVFPESVLTPVMAFAQADMIFAERWLGDEAAKIEAANIERTKRQTTRAAIGPNLQLALMIISGFFVVMFFFLLVAIERHLRPKKKIIVEHK